MLKRYYVINIAQVTFGLQSFDNSLKPILGPYTLVEAEEALKNISECRPGWIIVKEA